MDLATLKSAKVITDPGEIGAKLLAAHKDSPSLASIVDIDVKTQRAVITKRSASVLKAMIGVPPMPSREERIKLAIEKGFPNPELVADRVIQYWASDERVDGHGDIVLQNWKFDEYKNSPILAFSHNWQDPPIGGSIDWQVAQRVDDGYDGKALYLLTFFATQDTYAFADTIYRLVAARILRGGSVGFYAGKMIDVTDPAEREALGLGRYGYVLDDNMLVEFSPTTVGANPGALTIFNNAKAQGLLKPEDAPVYRELIRREAQVMRSKEQWSAIDTTARAFLNVVFPGLALRAHKDFDAPLVEIPESKRNERTTTNQRKDGSVEVRDITALEAKFDAFSTTMVDLLSGMAATLEDTRAMVETLIPDGSAPNADTPPAASAAASPSGDTFLARVCAAQSGKR